MAYVYSAVSKLKGKDIVGNGSCVLLLQRIARLPNTSSWRQGQRVVEQSNIWSGVAIATFENGIYPNWNTGNHAAFFVRFGERNSDGTAKSIWIMEQFKGLKKIALREVFSRGQVDSKSGKRWADPSNNADAFYIIE